MRKYYYPGQSEDVRIGLGVTTIVRDGDKQWRVPSLTWRDRPYPDGVTFEEIRALWEGDFGPLQRGVNYAGDILWDVLHGIR